MPREVSGVAEWVKWGLPEAYRDGGGGRKGKNYEMETERELC